MPIVAMSSFLESVDGLVVFCQQSLELTNQIREMQVIRILSIHSFKRGRYRKNKERVYQDVTTSMICTIRRVQRDMEVKVYSLVEVLFKAMSVGKLKSLFYRTKKGE